MSARIRAVTRLGWLYARHAVRRVARHPRRGAGLKRFLDLYAPDRLTAITALERQQLPEHGDCVACGLCGFAAGSAGYLRSDRLPLQLTRHLPDLWVARELELGAIPWEAAAAVCPMGVPLPAMSALVVGRLSRDGVAPPADRGM